MDRPANGEFTVELTMNRASTTLSYNGQYTGLFGDGQDHPGLGVTPPGQVPACITEPNSKSYHFFFTTFLTPANCYTVHTQNESMAAGTAFAISYQVICFIPCSESDRLTQ